MGKTLAAIACSAALVNAAAAAGLVKALEAALKKLEENKVDLGRGSP